jgi:hypothetical protein
MIKLDPVLKKPYAFVNFDSFENAERALTITHN